MTCAMEVGEIIVKQVYDDMSGRALDNKKVEAARDEEMEEVRNIKCTRRYRCSSAERKQGESP